MPTTPSSTWRERLRALPVLSEPIGTLDLDDLPATPGQLFTAWLNDAIAARVPEPHVMTLSTVDGDGLPNARTVILTDVAEAHPGAARNTPTSTREAGTALVVHAYPDPSSPQTAGRANP